jgi:NTP pyrophosphatase (non-canonical NTP hydrolase)
MTERDPSVHRIEAEPREKWGFSELQQRVTDIYQEHDKECGYGPDTMLIRLSTNALTLQKLLKNTPNNFGSINRNLTNVFIWTATFANAGGLDLQNIMEKKFGQGCPHCQQMPCLLSKKGEKCIPPQFPNKNKNIIIPPSNLDEWQLHLKKMYPNNYQGDITETLAFASSKLIEETIELSGSSYSDILRELKEASFPDEMLPWESEIADVLAWTFALSSSLDVKNGRYSAELSLKEKYKDGCPYCKSPKCICKKEKTFIEDLKK